MSTLSSLIKVPHVVTMPPAASVHEAAKKMKEHNIGSVVVMTGQTLEGIFTERDLLLRVAAEGLDPSTTALSQVMSKNVTTISITESVEACFSKMQQVKSRRIPVIDGQKVVGIVSMRDILEWLVKEMKEENIFLKKYIQT